MKEGYVPVVCLLVLTPVCIFFGWKFAKWYLQKTLERSEAGKLVQAARAQEAARGAAQAGPRCNQAAPAATAQT